MSVALATYASWMQTQMLGDPSRLAIELGMKLGMPLALVLGLIALIVAALLEIGELRKRLLVLALSVCLNCVLLSLIYYFAYEDMPKVVLPAFSVGTVGAILYQARKVILTIREPRKDTAEDVRS